MNDSNFRDSSGNVFEDLGFSKEEAAELLQQVARPKYLYLFDNAVLESEVIVGDNDRIHNLLVNQSAIENYRKEYLRLQDSPKWSPEKADKWVEDEQVIQHLHFILMQMRYLVANNCERIHAWQRIKMAKKCGYNRKWSNEQQKYVRWYK